MRWIRYKLALQIVMCLIAFNILSSHATSDSDDIRLERKLTRRLRGRRRGTRQALDNSHSSILKDPIGERNCTQEEEQKQGCLAGRCIAKVQSQVHTFIICSCPSNRRGARCEEMNIDIELMAEELKKLEPDELCKQERYDILFKSVGYESRFMDCVKKTTNFEKKLKKRERKRKERERKRRRKLRRRQRKRERRERLKAIKDGNSDSLLSDSFGEDLTSISESSELSTERTLISQELLSELQSTKNKTRKDHTGHAHVRHEKDKTRSKRSQMPLIFYLTGSSRSRNARNGDS